MKRGALLAAIAIVAVAAGGAALWFISWSKRTEEDKHLAELCGEVVKETTRTPVDVEACGALLQRLSRDPRRDDDPRLVRGRVELMLLLGKPTQQAWEVLEPLVTSADAGPEDLLLGARIMERRHAETGQASLAFRGALLAEEHFKATRKPESLLMAWLLAFRAEDKNTQARLAGTLAREFAESPSARLVAALEIFYKGYLRDRSLDKGALQTLAGLDRELDTAPPELTTALAARDIEGTLEQVQAALDRLEALTKTYRSSILARELLAVGYVKLRTVQGCEQSLFHLDWLLKNHPDKPAADFWRNLRPAVAAELERLRKGQKPVK